MITNFKKSIISICIIFLCTPVFVQILGEKQIFAIEENRVRLNSPSLDDIRHEGFSCVNDWYNDNFGMRDLLIRIQHQIDYTVFGYSKELFFGTVDNEEYLMYRNVVANEQIFNEKTPEDTRRDLIREFELIEKILTEGDISFKFIIPPQKNEVFEELDAKIPICRPKETMYLQMEKEYEASSLCDNYVSIIEPLKKANQKAPVFYKTDFHWNDWGAAVAFGEVVNSYSKDKGLGMIYDLDDLAFSEVLLGENDAQLASLSVLHYDLSKEITVNKNVEMQSIQGDNSKYPNYVILESSDAVFEGGVLLIGDSYTPPAIYSFNGTNSGISNLFSRVYFCHWDCSEGVLNNIPEDVKLVVIESIESGYSYLNNKLHVLY